MVNSIKEFAKKVLKKSKIGGLVYEPLHKIWRLYSVPRGRYLLHKYGYRLFAEIDDLMCTHNIPYYCEAGTLLGLVRDKGFIKHDDDIDLGIMPGVIKPADVLSVFINNGFSWISGHEYDGRFIEFTLEKYGIPVDFFFHSNSEKDGYYDEIFLRYYPDVNYPSEKNNSALLFRYVATKDVTRYSVHGIEVNIPTNVSDVLTSLYGPWDKPDPNFKSESTGYEILPHFAIRLSLDEALMHI